MYRWAWEHLPGSRASKTVGAVILAAAVVGLLAFVVLPLLRPVATAPPSDGSAIGNEDVIEPDGVRSTPLPEPSESTPTPIVPDDNGPQQ